MIDHIDKVDNADQDAAWELVGFWLSDTSGHLAFAAEGEWSMDEKWPAVFEPHLPILKVLSSVEYGPRPRLLNTDCFHLILRSVLDG